MEESQRAEIPFVPANAESRRSLSSCLPLLQGLLPAVGIFVSGALTLAHVRGLELPCGDKTGCELVADSPAAFVFGVPTAFLGFLVYATLIAAWFCGASRPEQRAWRTAGYVVSAAGSAVSFVLTGYSLVMVHASCDWCLASLLIFCGLFCCYAAAAYWDVTFGAIQDSLRIWQIVVGCAALAGFAGALLETLTRPLQAPAFNAVALGEVGLTDLEPMTAPCLGARHPRLTLVFFGDLQCNSCKHALPILADATTRRADCKLVYRHFPRKGHIYATEAAASAQQAKATVGFWNFVWKLYDQKEPLTLEHLRAVELWANLKPGKPSTAAQEIVEGDLALGRRLGLRTTPSIVIIEGQNKTVASFPVALAKLRTFR